MAGYDPNEYCVERVHSSNYRDPHMYRCSRKRGHGKDGLYCKQHALKHPAGEVETITMYVWYKRWSYTGQVDIPVAVQMLKATEQTVWFPDGRKQARMGDYENYYDTYEECYAAIKSSLDARIAGAHKTIEDAEKKLAALEKEEHRG